MHDFSLVGFSFKMFLFIYIYIYMITLMFIEVDFFIINCITFCFLFKTYLFTCFNFYLIWIPPCNSLNKMHYWFIYSCIHSFLCISSVLTVRSLSFCASNLRSITIRSLGRSSRWSWVLLSRFTLGHRVYWRLFTEKRATILRDWRSNHGKPTETCGTRRMGC